MIGIYKITNKINGKSYIGQSKHIKRRWREHISGTENSVIGSAIRKYGEESFEFSVIELCSIEDLHEKEKYYIRKYSSYGSGYNMTIGGDGVKGVRRALTLEQILELIKDLKKGAPSQLIADKYNVSVGYVNKINNGESEPLENETYPIRERYSERIKKEIDREELLRDVATLGFKETGEKHGLTGNGIKARCEMVGLPIHIKEIKELYGNSEAYIEAFYDGQPLKAKTVQELVDFIVENKLTTANKQSVAYSVRRVLNGRRKSYLGITITAKKREENTY